MGTLGRQMIGVSHAVVVFATLLPAPAQDVRIGVLGLFHPREIVIRADPASAAVVRAGEQPLVLEQSSGIDEAHLDLNGNSVVLKTKDREIRAHSLSLASREDGPADFLLAIPGKITRRYHGKLEVLPSAGSLIAIVTMDPETAVASIVAAESDPDTPLEALKAQAIATRSYLVAGTGRHHDFDFCDTTHCQFLRTPPNPKSPAARAVAATSGMILAYNAQPLAAMYTRSCGGSTRTPAEVGLPPAAYPYYSVECRYCREHPSAWQSRITSQQAANLHASDESARLEIDRLLGWSTVPSNNFTVKRTNNRVMLTGFGVGHGIGLCQSGAAAMAKDGATFAQILAHYYPNTALAKHEGAKQEF